MKTRIQKDFLRNWTVNIDKNIGTERQIIWEVYKKVDNGVGMEMQIILMEQKDG